MIGLLLSIIISIIYAYIGYNQKNVDQIYTTINVLGALPLVFLILDIFLSFSGNRFFKVYSFFSGNFTLKEDNNNIKLFKVLSYAQIVIFVIINLIIIPYGFYQFAFQFDPTYYLVSSIGFIAAGAALSNISFKYATEGTINSVYFRDVMLACAKRFYISTIYSILLIFFTIIIIILSKWIVAMSSSTLPNAVNLPLFEFSLIYLEFLIVSLILFFFILISLTTIRLFIEGLYLAFKGSIDFPNKIEIK
ncbi:MAG: hypothetical protein Q8N08_00780 [Methanobacteriaceae archaeon]|nr:hypothetical protein [Methanobacteriaceae archaeon]